MPSTSADYLVIGGGLTGCALAARLAELLDPALTILVLEAGPDPSSHPNTTAPMQGLALQGSEIDWSYSTAPNPATANRTFTLAAGKTLGGGSVLNYGGWARGDASDYDEWAQLIGDERWSYAAMLPYMMRTERFSKEEATPHQNGLDGRIKITGVKASDPKRQYPLREPLQKAWEELGVKTVPSCSGSLAGLSEFLETWDQGIRQPAHLAYGLANTRVEVRTNTFVNRILFKRLRGELPVATGVEIADGSQIEARKEVIVAAGALRSPQILQLSGVGPADMLNQYSIPLVYNSPNVGANLFDHFAFFQVYRLRKPERGLSFGHAAFDDPAFLKGFPIDWVANEALPADTLRQALAKDGSIVDKDGAEKTGRTHVETMVMYHPLAPGAPVDGSLIGTSIMLTIPTSRGSVGLVSSSPTDMPLIQPNYFSTSMDQATLIYGTRRLLECFTRTLAGQDIVEAEVAPGPGMKPLTMNSSDEEIRERIQAIGAPHFHPGGTCALGTVLNAELQVKGVQGLRVVDGSVFPAPLGGHPQATLYAVAERAATFISREKEKI